MAVTVFRWDDASAPALTGQVGSLTAVLDACLTNGYGAKAPLGWTRPYTGTNGVVYRSPSGIQTYVRVDDNAPNATSLAREAQARGYLAMSAFGTGTDPYPTVAQVGVSGLAVRKSATVDATARPWVLIGDDRTFYFFDKPGDFMGWTAITCGEFYSLLANDAYRALVVGRPTANSAVATVDTLPALLAVTSALVAGNYLARDELGSITGAITFSRHGDGIKGSATLLQGNCMYPNPPDGNILLSRVWVNEQRSAAVGSMFPRGRMRGLWHFLHPLASPISDLDTFNGTGDLAGKTFLVLYPTANADGVYIMETSNTWETN